MCTASNQFLWQFVGHHMVSHIIFNCMRRIILSLSFLCFLLFSTYAASLEDRYIMKNLENGQLYFILPFDIPSVTSKTKALSLDITYLTTSDSVTTNISVWTAQELQTDSIVFQGDTKIALNDFQTFFIERDGKLWLHRYSLRFPLKDLTFIYSGQCPFMIDIYAKGQEIHYSFPFKSWPKEQMWMNQILHIIDTNKRLYKK